MNIKTFLFLLFSVLLSVVLSFNTHAGQLGLGVDLKSNGNTVYLPVLTSNSLKIEPYLGYQKSDYDDNGFKMEFKNWHIGCGLFYVSRFNENFSLYYGGRGGLFEASAYAEFSSGNSESEIGGYHLEATIGFEYYYADTLSIGGEVFMNHSEYDGENKFSGLEMEYEVDYNSSYSRVLFRYYF